MMIKRFLYLFIFVLTPLSIFSQSIDEDKVVLSNFIERMWKNMPFEGCRIIEDYNKNYLLSVVTLDKNKYSNTIAMNRVAQVKSQRNAGEFINGTQSYSEFTIRTPKCSNEENGLIETTEIIKSKSFGYIQQMEILTNFEYENQKIFVYYKEL